MDLLRKAQFSLQQTNLPNMALPLPAKLSDPARCVIYCAKEKFEHHSEDTYGTNFVKEIVKYACGDFEKASILGIVKGEDVFIVFDYNNPEHLNTCKVFGFRIRRSIKPISVPALYVHEMVARWSFPHQGQVCSNIVYGLSHLKF
jgi:hypothetical protein